MAFSPLFFSLFLFSHFQQIDLAFPHHNNEIAQSCAANGCGSASDLFGCFVHVGHLHIEGQKMSKSLKNFISVSDFLQRHSSDVFRVFCMLDPYRTNTNFSTSKMETAASVLDKMTQFVAEFGSPLSDRSGELLWRAEDWQMWRELNECAVGVKQALMNEARLPDALHLLLNLTSKVRRYLRPNDARCTALAERAAATISSFLSMVGVTSHIKDSSAMPMVGENEKLAQVAVDIRARLKELGVTSADQSARKKLFEISDWSRDALASAGVEVRDGKGWVWKKK